MSATAPIRIAARAQPAKYAFIIFHGLGDSGAGWTFLAEYLQRDPALASAQFVFPTAPVRPITANNFAPATAWLDVRSWLSHESVDLEGFNESMKLVPKLIEEQVAQGIPYERIWIGGFSQGAALTMGTALSFPHRLGGFLSFSGPPSYRWLEHTVSDANTGAPVFQSHGTMDEVFPSSGAEAVHRSFTSQYGFKNHRLKIYDGLGHSISPQLLDDALAFIKANLDAEKPAPRPAL
ncbi:AGL188Wp [Eremothecium gossypii ATCC 10895]|uniref:Acyl-protein thioesterase 1 n=1 Tax=Eremothecium gossypii (strain ATCC 10895 / CBS 109.51 / FGSC 9923 / NRRL Y-1056) TaxID=284811 RepID=APTH1_EREGS|nr:AGL188Wp [Eremothecium gossypii ATCC 10895]Q750X7.1 RecName: Full=Acyl-protein thioesterase 1; AltName: Full=Palmitoyl-protein hydrolase [Eremothecium gossypii ATCC 10895]AAS54303.1 AGL188Wp [Eremothecium gossypii ATCC 10895]AEY98629.1 FAGL188Wp [Eremothecium gossypii FDAG1]